MAHNLGLDRICLESDCLPLVDARKNRGKHGEIVQIVEDIEKLSLNFISCSFTWTPREGNMVVHLVASLGSRNLLAWNWASSLPMQIARALIEDSRWIPPRG